MKGVNAARHRLFDERMRSRGMPSPKRWVYVEASGYGFLRVRQGHASQHKTRPALVYRKRLRLMKFRTWPEALWE